MNLLPVKSTNIIPESLKSITKNSSEFDKYNAFLKEALQRCANLETPYDRVTEVPITPEELEKFCDAAAELGLPVTYVGYNTDDTTGFYAGYPTWDMLNEVESCR